VRISFDGRELGAYENESIGAALHAAGVRIFSRSFKYHRPRGLFCMSGRCPNCMMRVNGVANVRVCMEPVREGAMVKSQNSFPNVSHDMFSVMDRFDFLFPIGFQYKKFIRPRFMWKYYERIIRETAGVADIPDPDATSPSTYPAFNIKRDVEVAIVGGGPAGLAAAISASKAGATVVLFDENFCLGGHLVKQTSKESDAGVYSGLRGFEIARRLLEEIKPIKTLAVYPETTVSGCFEGGILTISRQMSFQELTPKATILALGTYERTMLFENNDLPGIFSANGARTLMHVYGMRPGHRAVVTGHDGTMDDLAVELLEADVEVAAIVRPTADKNAEKRPAQLSNVPILSPFIVKSANGRKHVDRIEVVQVRQDGQPISGTERSVRCDTLCYAGGTNPAFDLLFLAGCRMRYDPERDAFLPTTDRNLQSAPGIFAAGDVCGSRSIRETILEGSIGGLSAALHVGRGGKTEENARDDLIAQLPK